MRFPSSRAAWVPAAVVAAGLLGACSTPKVGKGNAPERLYLGVTGEEASAKMSECTTLALNAYVEFSDQDATTSSNFNTRVVWESENPSIVFVSDGVTRSPEGLIYPAGTLVALRPGAATIAADYLDFHAAIVVDVSELTQVRIDNDLTDIGENLQQAFKLKAVLAEGQAEQDISSTGIWRFDPATARALVDPATGVVEANSSSGGESLRLVARLPECDREVSTSFRISPVTSTSIDYFERGDARALPIGFSEAFRVTAGFADAAAPRQDVTTQTTIDAIDDDTLSAVLGEDAWTVTALDRVGDGHLSLKLGTLETTLVSKTWSVQNTGLIDLVLSPQDDLRITYPDTGQLTVTGTFDNGLVMPITRHVTWTSSDTALGTVATTSDDAGEITIQDINGDFDVTASYVLDKEVLDEVITVHAYANDQ